MADRQIDYIEFPAGDIAKTKEFYIRVFGWEFTDYGPDYTSFEDGRIAGGFSKTENAPGGNPLVVMYGADLAEIEAKVKAEGGTIVKETFAFPGAVEFQDLEMEDPGDPSPSLSNIAPLSLIVTQEEREVVAN
jgi:predicted enzyme related to lactoylglutathione lyase